MVPCQFFEVKFFEIYGAANIQKLLVLFQRFFLVTILSRMFLRQRTYALLLVMILIGVIMLAQSAVYGALSGLRRLADVTPFAVHMRLVVALVIFFLLVPGMSIVEGFLTIFLMSPTQFWAVLC
jgi:hypothetical protein